MSDKDFGFWDSLEEGKSNLVRIANSHSMDGYLSGVEDDLLIEKELQGRHATAMQALTDKGRSDAALPLTTDAGTRVSFISNVGSLLTYDECPEPGSEGTIVTVRTAVGDTTHHDTRFFVKFDDGVFMAVDRVHLRAVTNKKQATNFRRVVSSLGDLSEFLISAGSKQSELVHKSTQDIWSFHMDGDSYVIERLFDDSGEPLKV